MARWRDAGGSPDLVANSLVIDRPEEYQKVTFTLYLVDVDGNADPLLMRWATDSPPGDHLMLDHAGTKPAGDARSRRAARLDHSQPIPSNYKWVALFVSTLGMLMATIDASITLIALPDIFRGIGIDPLLPGNSFYLLWMILGFLVVTSVLVVSFGRLGDIYGRVRIYNLGFAVFTLFSLALSVTWLTGHPAGIWLIVMRIFQGVGAAMLASTRPPRSAAPSSGWCSAGFSLRSIGASSSWSRSPSGCSGR
jgi:hypothetical protein